MIKRIIFDLDGTLIIPNYDKLGLFLKRLNNELDEEFILNLNSYFKEFESFNDKYSYEKLFQFLKEKSDGKLNYNHFMKMIDYSSNIEEEDFSEMIDMFRSISKKYEIYVLTNWFKYVQILKLKKAGIYEYIDKIVCGEEVLKPNEKAYKLCSKGLKKEECLFVGDNYVNDVISPIKLGYKAILFDKMGFSSQDKVYVLKNINYLVNYLEKI